MRFFIFFIPAALAFAFGAKAADLSLPIDNQTHEFITRVSEQTGVVELQTADGSWQVVNEDPGEVTSPGTGLVEKVQYYGGPPYYGGGGYAPYPQPYPNPNPYYCPPQYPNYPPRVYWNQRYYNPYRYNYGGGYRYYGWRVY